MDEPMPDNPEYEVAPYIHRDVLRVNVTQYWVEHGEPTGIVAGFVVDEGDRDGVPALLPENQAMFGDSLRVYSNDELRPSHMRGLRTAAATYQSSMS